MLYPAKHAQPFIDIDIHGNMQSFSPADLVHYFKVHFTATNIIPKEALQSVVPQLELARLFYEDVSPDNTEGGQNTNQQRLQYVPEAGIESIPDYLYLKVITIQDVPQLGLFAKRSLPIGAWVGVYAGELFPVDFPTQSLHAMAIIDPNVKTTLKIDAKNWGNHIRFCNHSYAPNITRELVFNKGMYHVILHATRIIEPHQQLLFDYGKDYWQLLGIEPEVLE